jgi:hypothetical protein
VGFGKKKLNAQVDLLQLLAMPFSKIMSPTVPQIFGNCFSPMLLCSRSDSVPALLFLLPFCQTQKITLV